MVTVPGTVRGVPRSKHCWDSSSRAVPRSHDSNDPAHLGIADGTSHGSAVGYEAVKVVGTTSAGSIGNGICGA